MQEVSGIKKKTITAFAVFLILMWICTLISKSVYAYQLPMVTCTSPEQRSLEHVVEADGVVVEGGSCAVISPEGTRVESILVNEGDMVSAGDTLFTIDLSDLSELMRKEEAEAQKIQVQINTYVKNQGIQNQKKALEQSRALEDYESAVQKQDEANRRAESQYANAESALKRYKDETTASAMNGSEKAALENSLQSAEFDRNETAGAGQESVRNAARNVQDSFLPEEYDSAFSMYQFELKEIQERIRKYRGIQEDGGNVKAKAEGMITEILISTGGRVPDTASMLMTDESRACRFKAVIEKDQLRYVGIGDFVTLELAGQKKTDASVETLVESRTQPGTYEISVSLPDGVGMPGMSGTLKCTKSGERESCCIPLEALCVEESGRCYVYVLNEREGIMGQEYYVQEANVRVSDKNMMWAALEEGGIGADSMVVVSATKEFKKGDTVRYAEGE